MICASDFPVGRQLRAFGRPTASAFALLLVLAFAGQPVHAQAPSEGSPPATQVLALPIREEFSQPNIYGDMLLREIGRQALLIAGREGLGLATRDRAIRERMPPGQSESAAPVQFVSVLTTDDPAANQPPTFAKVSVLGPPGDAPNVLWEKSYELGPREFLERYVGECEKLSRGEFIAALQRAGFRGTPNSVAPEAGVPDPIAFELNELAIVPQFSGVRALHALIRREGESLARIGELSRGYANLGWLTEGAMSPAHKAFKARALLYAERAVASALQSPLGFWHRAYVRGIVGMHDAALKDIETAEALFQMLPENPEKKKLRPEWVDSLVAYCRFDVGRLQTLAARRGSRPLGRLLLLQSLDNSSRTDEIVRTAEKVLEVSPDCYLAIDLIFRTSELDTTRRAADQGPEAAAKYLYRRTRYIPGLPKEIADFARDAHRQLEGDGGQAGASRFAPADVASRVELVRRLRAAGIAGADVGEPSWCALAAQIEDIGFLHAVRTVQFFRDWLSIPAAQAVDELAPLVAEHPFRLLFELQTDDMPKRQALARAFPGDFDYSGVEESTLPLIAALGNGNEPSHARLQHAAFIHNDILFHDLALIIRTRGERSDEVKAQFARMLFDVSSRAPVSVALQLGFNWPAAEPRATEWEKSYADSPEVQRALGLQYTRLKRFDDAERCLKRLTAISPIQQSYAELAELYDKQGKEAEWKATWDEFLSKESFGLDHASARTIIAHRFMHRRQWREALPYADAAARTGAQWAMMCAARVHEALQAFDVAESLHRAITDRYGTTLNWLFYCARTGKGDRKAAEAVAQRFIASAEAGEFEPDDYALAMAYRFTNQPHKALERWKAHFEKEASPYFGLEAALLADELGDAATRDALLAKVLPACDKWVFDDTGLPRKELKAIVQMMVDDLAKEGSAAFKADDVEQALGNVGRYERLNGRYFAGRYCRLHGNSNQARELLLRAMGSTEILAYYRTLAGFELNEMGIAAEAYSERMFLADPIPPSAPNAKGAPTPAK